MKKIITISLISSVISIISLIFIISPVTAATMSTDVRTGLVGWWTFDTDQVVGTSARDSSASKSTATLTGSTVPTITAGKFGQAMRIPQSTYGYADAGKKNMTFTTGFSIAFWEYPEYIGAWHIILGKEIWNNGTGFLIWAYDSDGTLAYTVPSGGVTLANALTLNTWTHFVITNDNGSVRIYKNGVLATTGSAAISNADVNLFIGSRHGNDGTSYTDSWWGKIDDVRVFNRPLYPEEVRQIYRFGAGSKINQSKTTDSLTRGLIGWWTFDAQDIYSTVIGDKSGQNHSSTYYAGTKIPGKIGQGLRLNGTSDYVDLGTFVNTPPLTRTAWVKTSNTSAQNSFLSNYADGTGIYWGTSYSNQVLVYVGTGSPAGSSSNSTVSDGKWHFAAFSTDGSVTKFYIDGNPDGQTNQTIGACNSQSVTIGIQAGYFKGDMDDVRMYNRVLSATEIKQLYNLGQSTMNNSAAVRPANGNLQAWWTFDGQDLYPASASDKSGNNLTLTRTGATPIKGRLGQGITLAGESTDNFVSASNSILDTDVHTIAFWMRMNAEAASWTSILSYTPGGDDRSPGIWKYATLRCLHWRYNPSNTGLSCGGPTGESSYFTLGKWYHIVGVKNAATFKFYVDGTQQGADVSVANPKTAGSAVVTIGKNTWYTAAPVTLDDVRIWNRALSATEIKQLYNGTK